jgi:hypothetical protein
MPLAKLPCQPPHERRHFARERIGADFLRAEAEVLDQVVAVRGGHLRQRSPHQHVLHRSR